MRLGFIVEGHGDQLAVPTLAQRIYVERLNFYNAIVGMTPMRVKRGKFAERFDDYERALRFLSYGADAILVLLDSDDEDPGDLSAGLARRADAEIGHIPVAIAPAVHEYEAWFLASIEQLRGQADVRDDAACPGTPESHRGAKGVFASQLRTGIYSETIDQKKYSALIDLAAAESNSPSFRALRDALSSLIPA
jgi:hypothetical protein